MNLKNEIERLKKDYNGETYWLAMDLYRFLDLSDWKKFEQLILELKAQASYVSAHVIQFTIGDVVDYLLSPEAIFFLLNKINGNTPRRAFAINYFDQFLSSEEKQRAAIDATKKGKTEMANAQVIKKAFADLCKKNQILVKKSTWFYMLSDWFIPRLINELNDITGDNFMADISLILSTYLDIVKAKQKEFGFSDEAIKRLSYDINFAYSTFEGYVAKERGDR